LTKERIDHYISVCLSVGMNYFKCNTASPALLNFMLID